MVGLRGQHSESGLGQEHVLELTLQSEQDILWGEVKGKIKGPMKRSGWQRISLPEPFHPAGIAVSVRVRSRLHF